MKINNFFTKGNPVIPSLYFYEHPGPKIICFKYLAQIAHDKQSAQMTSI